MVTEAPVSAPVGPLDGFLLLDKPSGMSSQQGVTRVRRALGAVKAGHAGTLDPMATGLLVIGLGRATRLLGHIADRSKTYEALIRLGGATTTDDAEGEALGEPVDATHLGDEAIRQAMANYRGVIDQVPSAVSAIKVKGRRAYALVRQGETVELKPRQVRVEAFDLLGRSDHAPWVDLSVRVDCSTGTYIRALARDLGHDLGVGGHLTALRRTRIGPIDLAQAVRLEEVSRSAVVELGRAADWVAPRLEVDQELARQVAFGRSIDRTVAGELAAVFWEDRLLGLYRPDPETAGRALPVAVLVTPDDLREASEPSDGRPDGWSENDDPRVPPIGTGGAQPVAVTGDRDDPGSDPWR